MWTYGPLDVRNKPVQIANDFGDSVKQNAGRVWTLLRLLPIMVGSRVPEDCPEWEILLLLKDIAEYAFAPKIMKSQCAHLHAIIQDHHQLLLRCFPNIRLKPKHHFIAHYPELILKFGPLRSCWCMRFEAKHSYFKSLVLRLHNFINVCQMLARRHERHQAYQALLCKDFLTPEIVVSNSVLTHTEFLSPAIQELIKNSQLGSQRTINQSNAIQVNGIYYNVGMYIVSGYRHDTPVFGEILNIFVNNAIVAFLIKKQTAHFHAHYRAYKVCETEEMQLVLYQDLIDYYPLTCYSVAQLGRYVVLKHAVF
jgi:hypothetical protein